MSAPVCSVRVHLPLSWAHIEDPVRREHMEALVRPQIGRYAVALLIPDEVARFFGSTPLAALAVVDDFGNLVRVQ